MDDAFLNAYCAIDKDLSGEITKAELQSYQRENNYDDAFVEKWFRLFDRKNTGIIKVAEFCDVLGLEVKDIQTRQAELLQAGNKSLPADVKVIYSDMSTDLQYDIFQIVLEAHKKHNVHKDVVQYIKQQCDQRFDKLWHTVMIQGQYWAFYSHEPENSFIFKYGLFIYLIWRTPAP